MSKQIFCYARSSGVEGAEAYIRYDEHPRSRYDKADRNICEDISEIRINQSQFYGKTAKLNWSGKTELFHDLGPVGFYRARTDAQYIRYLLG